MKASPFTAGMARRVFKSPLSQEPRDVPHDPARGAGARRRNVSPQGNELCGIGES
jgi:hypothetical protein